MTEFDEIAAFLKDQWAAEERLARDISTDYAGDRWAAARSTPDGYMHPDGPHLETGDELLWVMRVPDGVWLCDDPDDDCESLRAEWMRRAEYLAHWDPRRVLAEIESKRAVLHALAEVEKISLDGNVWTLDGPVKAALRALLAPYADRPGFKPQRGGDD